MITRAFHRRPPFAVLALWALIALVPACRTGDNPDHSMGDAHDEAGHAHGTDDGHAGEDEHAEDLVRLTPEQLERFGVAVEEARPGAVDSFTELPGEVRANGDNLAHVVPRYPGIVREVRKTVGDSVRAGEVLAVVESSESLATYQLTTAIDGVVIDKHITRGEAIDREKGAFVVADLTNVWVDLAVYQKDLDNVSRGQAVRISSGKEVPSADGTISYITPTVDAPTRTATARVVLANVDGRWRPGMFVTARVLAPLQASLVVPLSAVQTFEGNPVVFVETPDGFVPRPVTLGVRGETRVAVLSGLEPGERYVTSKSFLLKAELGKGEAEHEH